MDISSFHFVCEIVPTKVLDQDLLPSHHILELSDVCPPVFQNLLLLRIEEAQSFGVDASGLLRQLVLNILDSCLLVDLDARWEFPDGLLRS